MATIRGVRSLPGGAIETVAVAARLFSIAKRPGGSDTGIDRGMQGTGVWSNVPYDRPTIVVFYV